MKDDADTRHRRRPGRAVAEPLPDAGRPRPRHARAWTGRRALAQRALVVARPCSARTGSTACPGLRAHADRDGFLGRGAFVDYLERYARSFAAPVVEEAEVLSVDRAWSGFRVETDSGRLAGEERRDRDRATPQLPSIPGPSAGVPAGLRQLHSSGYWSPEGLPPGGVLVVGAGPSGQQLALELRQAGREVVHRRGQPHACPAPLPRP